MDKLFTRTQPLPHGLATLIQQTEAHQQLLLCLRHQLPSAIQDALSDCVIQGNQLILTAPNPAMLNRLRLHQYQFLNIAQQEYPQLTDISYSLAQRISETSLPLSIRKPQSATDEQTAQAIRDLAEKINDDGLSNSLRVLSQVLSKQSKTQIQ
jgi:hypothetical protein